MLMPKILEKHAAFKAQNDSVGEPDETWATYLSWFLIGICLAGFVAILWISFKA